MSDNKEKKFSICQGFNNLSELKKKETTAGETTKRFGASWKIDLFKYASGDITSNVRCECSQTGDWSINTVFDLNFNGKVVITGRPFEFNQKDTSLPLPFIKKADFANFRIQESFTIEFHVKIISITGFPEKQRAMKFDGRVAKEASDVVLIVGDRKFYVCKTYLSFHSTYFKDLLLGNVERSKRFVKELKDIDPEDFQDFLQVLYAVSQIEHDTCLEILKLADLFDANVVVRRCEDFLMNQSKETLKIKFQLAVKYKLDELKKKCFAEMTEKTNYQNFIPENSADFDTDVWKELYSRAVSFMWK
ncbi:unnamed protein product [Caenorhabditis nigoni]